MSRRRGCQHSRFDHPDPYDGSYVLTDPQSLNRYAYVQNDPVNFIDPSGLQEEVWDPGEVVRIATFTRGLGTTLSEMGFGRGDVRPITDAEARGNLGGEPQETTPTPPTDCQRFADRVAEIASRYNDVRGFVDDLARTFIGVTSSDVDVMRQNANTSTGEYFSSTGFRDGLFDNIRDNQARHFMGGLIAGYNLGSTAGALVMNHNENSQADLRVNEISIPIGANLTNPRPAREVMERQMLGDYRVRTIPANRGFRGLADMIRNQICAR